jgi:hypothetical protein
VNIENIIHNKHYKMKKKMIFAGLVFAALPAFAQMSETELADPRPAPAAAWQAVKNITLGWGSTDMHYQRNAVPALAKTLNLYAWKGERVSAQAVLLTPKAVKDFSFTVSDLRSGKNVIPSSAVNKYFVRYVMSDVMGNKNDSCLVGDWLKPADKMSLEAQNLRPMWLDIRVPQNAASGKYKGTLTARCDGKSLSIPFVLEVGKRTLPEASKWKFHLDLWQNPYSVARFYNVPLWSKQHFDLMRPIMKLLAEAGQKVITCSIIQHPWNSQTEDPFESMIGKFKSADGKWKYDYAVFDKWVEFMMSCGITEQIDCYTIVPWHLTFEYYDEAQNCTRQQKLDPGSKEYEEYLLPFLTDFASHLKQKGWFKKTCIAMDERPKDLLEPAYKILYKADKDFRVEGAVNYFGPEVAERMYDISFLYDQPLLTPEQLSSHLGKGNRITFYTCCVPERPNTFIFSNPAESAFMGWHAAAAGYSGYLRWAYNSWVKNPLQDTRFRTWAAGDCFLVYPGGSSIRMERLTEGIQDYEKIRILRSELKGDKLKKLDEELKKFAPTQIGRDVDVEKLVNDGKALLRTLEK